MRLYLENGLMRWLNDEISEGEYEELMQQFATIKPVILPFYWLKLRCHFRNNQGTIYEKRPTVIH